MTLLPCLNLHKDQERIAITDITDATNIDVIQLQERPASCNSSECSVKRTNSINRISTKEHRITAWCAGTTQTKVLVMKDQERARKTNLVVINS